MTAGIALAFPVFTLLALVSSGNVNANHQPNNTQECQEQFEKERAMCQGLTGQARAACQRQAAERFRMCRGQASPTQVAASAISSIVPPASNGGASNDLGSPNTKRISSSERASKSLFGPLRTRQRTK
jgi:hypothetical protein